MGKKNKKPAPPPESLGLPFTGVETHAHLDLEHFDEDRGEVLARAAASGVRAIGNVFLGPDAYDKGRALFDDVFALGPVGSEPVGLRPDSAGAGAGRPEIFFLLGIHPHDATGCDQDALARIQAACGADERIKALGETGLDYFYDHSPRDVQRRAFRDQIALARTLDLPVAVHSRDAFEDTLKILLDMGMHKQPLVWHCFGGDRAMAEELLSHHWVVSIPGPVTFPKNTPLHEAVQIIPVEQLVVETDCPYLTPAPYRGKRNEPAYAAFTAARVAELKGMSPADLWTAAGKTADRIFGL